jgi:hypothetical protein
MDSSVTNLVREIADAAKAAGVRFEHCRNGRRHQVYRLGTSVTVIIPNSKVKPLVRLDILRQCAPELGTRWWDKSKSTTSEGDTMPSEERVNEEWRPVHGMSGLWEISNAGRVRNAVTKRLLTLKGNTEAPVARLTDHKGRIHEKNVVHMVRTTFGHRPLKNVWFDNNDPDRDRKERSKVRELLNPISHQLPDEKIEELKARVEEPETIEDRAEEPTEGDNMTIQASELGIPVETVGIRHDDPDGVPVEIEYRPFKMEGIAPHYQVSERGEVLGLRGPLDLMVIPEYEKVIVNMQRTSDSPYTGAARIRLDVAVCTAFHGEQPSPVHGPKHINGDWRDCSAANLVWAQGYAVRSAPKKPKPGKLREQRAARRAARQLQEKAQAQQVPEVEAVAVATDKADAMEAKWTEMRELALANQEARSNETKLLSEVQVITTKTYVCGTLRVPVLDDGPKFPPTESLELDELVSLGKIAAAIKAGL